MTCGGFVVPHLMIVILTRVVIGGTNFFQNEDARLVQGTNTNLGDALRFLRQYDEDASRMCLRVRSAQWAYSVNMTDFNKMRMVEEQTVQARFDKETWAGAARFDWTRLSDAVARRQIRTLVTNSRASLSDDKFNEIYHLISEMKDLYSHVRVCPFVPYTDFPRQVYCDLELEDVKRTMSQSRNNLELVHFWREWHDKSGPQLKNRFMRYVELANQAAKLNGFQDAGEQLRYVYEDSGFENDLAGTFQKLQPLYKELFTYVRRKLFEKYGANVVRIDGPLPAHLLGNLWAQEWSGVFDIVKPYPEFGDIDVSDVMLRQGFTPLRMFQMAEEFYSSLGLKPMPPEFWRFSMLERPKARKVQCTASAWDFCNKIDFRIKQCTEVDLQNLITAHHEMAHVQYYMYYADQPYLYRDGANPGFHEGVSNAIVLSVFNPVHLYRVGLYKNNTDLYENNINFLMKMALMKVAYAPFAYLLDEWRYQLFEYGVNNMNADWWDLRLRFSGVIPPVPRSESHFDAASKRHVPADVPYTRYYVALLLEFQIYKSMCIAAGHSGPLHTCDIYRSREAGRVLSDILRVGKARHWKDVIKMLTKGQSGELSEEAMLEYFQPLLLWLQSANKNEPAIGWTTNKEDVALFQPLIYNSSCKSVVVTHFFIFSVIIFLNFS